MLNEMLRILINFQIHQKSYLDIESSPVVTIVDHDAMIAFPFAVIWF